MNRKYFFMIIFMILTTLLFGCRNDNGYSGYLKALENMDKIKSLNSLVEFQLKMDFDDTNLSSEEKKNLEMYSNFQGSILMKKDKEQNRFYMDGHVDTQNMGFDFKVYDQKDNMIILMPVFSKYMIIDKEKLLNSNASENQENIMFSPEELENLWKKNVRQDNITKLPDKVVATNEGDVKAAVIQITLTENEVKALSKEFNDLIFKNNKIKEMMEKSFQEAYKGKDELDFAQEYDLFITEMQRSMDAMKVVNFRYTGAFDKDYYIVDESMAYDIEMPVEGSKPIKINYSFQIKNWNLNKPVEFEIPHLDDKNSFTLDKLDENTPKLLEKFIKDPTER